MWATNLSVRHTIFLLSGSMSWNTSYLLPRMASGTGRGSSRSLSGWSLPNLCHALFFSRLARAGLVD